MCKEFQRGQCDRGDHCRYCHVAEDLRCKTISFESKFLGWSDQATRTNSFESVWAGDAWGDYVLTYIFIFILAYSVWGVSPQASLANSFESAWDWVSGGSWGACRRSRSSLFAPTFLFAKREVRTPRDCCSRRGPSCRVRMRGWRLHWVSRVFGKRKTSHHNK